jgi:NADH dehydrogenase/NADH:ubiquinone oxidoreductase subunit G
MLFDGEVLDQESALKQYGNLLKRYSGNVSVVIDANLYIEEIEAIVTYAQSIKAKTYAPLACYDDPLFADEMLKSAQRAANYAYILKLGLETSAPSNAELIINFNHPSSFKTKAEICFSTYQRDSKELTLPIAAFSENSGSLINEDGIVQWCEKAVERNNPSPAVLEWLVKVQR